MRDHIQDDNTKKYRLVAELENLQTHTGYQLNSLDQLKVPGGPPEYREDLRKQKETFEQLNLKESYIQKIMNIDNKALAGESEQQVELKR